MPSLRDFAASILKLFGKTRSSSEQSSGTSNRSTMRLDGDAELTAWFRNNECCPDCGGSEFLDGPRGGLSRNMSCAGCGSEYNIARYEGRIITVDRIRRDVPPTDVVIVTRPAPREHRVLH